MKKNFTLVLVFMAFSISYGQYNVPLTNADVESSSAMSTSDNVKYTIDGMFINEAADGAFDETSSGLAPGDGVSSQAFKVVTQSGAQSWHATFFVDRADISGYGFANFTFSFQIKSATEPASYPIWMIIKTFDEDGADVSSSTLANYSAGGATTDWWLAHTGYQIASIPFSITANASGKNAKFVELRVQMSKEANTYWLDNLSLESSAALSLKSFEKIGVTMFPNPASNFTTIRSNSGLEKISLYSITGKLLLDKKLITNEF